MCFDDPRPEMGDGNREWAAEKGNITIMAQNDIGIDLGTTTIIIAQDSRRKKWAHITNSARKYFLVLLNKI